MFGRVETIKMNALPHFFYYFSLFQCGFRSQHLVNSYLFGRIKDQEYDKKRLCQIKTGVVCGTIFGLLRAAAAWNSNHKEVE